MSIHKRHEQNTTRLGNSEQKLKFQYADIKYTIPTPPKYFGKEVY